MHRVAFRLRRLCMCSLLAGGLLLVAAFAHAWYPAPAGAASSPDAACSGCHAAIYTSYERTSMARGSGPALLAFNPGSFTDAKSGVSYRIFQRNGQATMTATRPFTAPGGALQTEHRLDWFIGSGKHGRTYLYRQSGMLWELPINWYTRRAAWDMAPAYSGNATLPAPLPSDAACLHCHVTGIAASTGTARNALPDPPFAQAGIGCSSCHGDPAAHLAAGGHGPIVNPDKLTPARRDSACITCHLEGDAVIFRPGRSPADFKPDDTLNDLAVYFVRASENSGGSRASSQYEAMMQSACKRGSGDRLTCTTCHDPHSQPTAAERVQFYRAKCLACHTSPALATNHHPEQPDCASCHMPTRTTSDISHEQAVDHNIQRTPATQRTSKSGELMPVSGFTSGTRELGLAYAQLARQGDQSSGRRALALLTDAAEHGATDAQVLLNLGFLYQVSGHPAQAATAYKQVLKTEPYEPAALGNLAVLEAGNGQVPAAKALLQTLIDADASQTAAGMNLVLLQCRTGDSAGAKATVAKLQPLNPDAPALHAFQQNGCAMR